jgi:hypothetical protein
LGNIIFTKGITIDPKMIESIRVWISTISVTEVISFMGLARYYKIFIKGFSKIANPITYLQNKGV